MADDEAKCSNCEFYKATRHKKHGYCLRYPPVFTHIDQETGYPRFFYPVVNPVGWCGEYTDADDE